LPSGDLSRIKEKTMKLRVILVCTLLLLAAVPSFALPPCQECNQFNRCAIVPWAVEACYDGPGFCDTNPFENCTHRSATTVLTEWKVVSIEISRPALTSATVTAQAAAAEVSAPTPQITELK
jgi:hypothetical protein